MTENKKIMILNVAKYIIENKATIDTTATHFNLSTSCIKKYINDKDNLQSLDMTIYNDVKKVQQYLIEVGHSVGGKNGIGVSKSKYTDFEAMEIAETMINDGLTVKEASQMFSIPSSTLYDKITSIDDEVIKEKLQILFDENNLRFGNGNIAK